MASKFVTLAEAAQQLGITPEAVNELRQRGDLYGYRDGTSWKFKPEDVERVLEQRQSGGGLSGELTADVLGDSQEISDLPMDLPIDPDDADDAADDVVLLSEFELGESGPSASATVIGQPGLPLSSLDSDVKLVATGEELSDASRTTIGKPGSPQRPGESVIKLTTPTGDESSTSKTFIGTPGQPLGPDDSAIKLRASGPLESPSSTVIGKPGQQQAAGDSEIKLSTFEDSDFDVGSLKPQSPNVIDAGQSPSGASTVLSGEPPAQNVAVDSGITLADEHSDDDFVLGGPGSDITISPGDSGISLVDPADSGLSLDAPIELSAAGSEASFEVSESGDDLGSPSEFDSDEVMDLKTSDEFLLTPMAPEGEESSEDSGSQVIAIDSEASPFEATDSSMFASAEGSMAGMLEEDVGPGGPALADSALGGPVSPAFATAAGPAPMVMGETPWPAWVVFTMGFCVLFLALCGMMMYDLVRNMWSWNGPYQVNSAIMDAIMGLFG